MKLIVALCLLTSSLGLAHPPPTGAEDQGSLARLTEAIPGIDDAFTMKEWCVEQAQNLKRAEGILDTAPRCVKSSQYSLQCLQNQIRVLLDGYVSKATWKYEDLQGISTWIPLNRSVSIVNTAIANVRKQLETDRADLIKRAASYELVARLMESAPRSGFTTEYIPNGLNYPNLAQHVSLAIIFPEKCAQFKNNQMVIVPDKSKAAMAGGFSPVEKARLPVYEKKVEAVLATLNVNNENAVAEQVIAVMTQACGNTLKK